MVMNLTPEAALGRTGECPSGGNVIVTILLVSNQLAMIVILFQAIAAAVAMRGC